MSSSFSTPIHRSSRGWSVATSVGSVVAAFLASACCVGPLLLALLGLGGGALLVKLEPYRPLFVALTLGVLASGFYVTYRKPKTIQATPAHAPEDIASGDACGCPAPRTRRVGRIMLWIATALVALFLVFPYVAPHLFG